MSESTPKFYRDQQSILEWKLKNEKLSKRQRENIKRGIEQIREFLKSTHSLKKEKPSTAINRLTA